MANTDETMDFHDDFAVRLHQAYGDRFPANAPPEKVVQSLAEAKMIGTEDICISFTREGSIESRDKEGYLRKVILPPR